MGETARQRLERLQREGLKPDGKWNRRVVRHEDGSLAIHEVHYAPDGTVRAWTDDASEAVDPEDGLEGLISSIEFTFDTSLEAVARPILEARDLPGGRKPS